MMATRIRTTSSQTVSIVFPHGVMVNERRPMSCPDAVRTSTA
jgi:hypothetical protein